MCKSCPPPLSSQFVFRITPKGSAEDGGSGRGGWGNIGAAACNERACFAGVKTASVGRRSFLHSLPLLPIPLLLLLLRTEAIYSPPPFPSPISTVVLASFLSLQKCPPPHHFHRLLFLSSPATHLLFRPKPSAGWVRTPFLFLPFPAGAFSITTVTGQKIRPKKVEERDQQKCGGGGGGGDPESPSALQWRPRRYIMPSSFSFAHLSFGLPPPRSFLKMASCYGRTHPFFFLCMPLRGKVGDIKRSSPRGNLR